MVRQAGSVTLWVVGVLVLFAVLLSASLQFITRQSHATIIQEQEEQAFAAAEGGIHHALWLLNSGSQTIASLPGIVVDREPLTNSTGEVVARFSLRFEAPASDRVTVTATGSDEVQPDICQIIRAQIGPAASGGYAIADWEHLIEADCVPTSPGVGRLAAAPTAITLGSTHDAALTDAEPVHDYTFTVSAGDQIRLTVQSSTFTPRLTVTDAAGVVVAQYGEEWQLAHVRYEARLRQIQDSLTTFAGRGTDDGGCASSIYTACIPRDLEGSPLDAWWSPPADGTYQVEIGIVTGQVGDYRFETEKR